MAKVAAKARALDVPLKAHIDLTWKCNERCIHCYLDHGVGGDMNTAEIIRVLDQLAAAGTLFLVISGGEIMLRKDVVEIVAYARSLLFDVKLKTNATLIGEHEAARFAGLGVRKVDVSIYSHIPDTHDAITLMPGSFARSIAGIRHLKQSGVAVTIHASVMRPNAEDYSGIRALASELGVEARFNTQITPRLDGNKAPVSLNVLTEITRRIYTDPNISAYAEEFCVAPLPVTEQELDAYPCGAGHASCYISPSGDVTPCVHYPVVCGNLRNQSFDEIWRASPALIAVRRVRVRDMTVCSTCADLNSCRHCPGLAYIEGDSLGPSSLDCERAFARTGIPSPLVQFAGATNPVE